MSLAERCRIRAVERFFANLSPGGSPVYLTIGRLSAGLGEHGLAEDLRRKGWLDLGGEAGPQVKALSESPVLVKSEVGIRLTRRKRRRMKFACRPDGKGQNGFTITRMTMPIMSKVGTSFMMR